MQRKLLTKDALMIHRIPRLDGAFSVCGLDRETDEHLFFRCRFSSLVIKSIGNWLNSNGLKLDFDNLFHNFQDLKLASFG